MIPRQIKKIQIYKTPEAEGAAEEGVCLAPGEEGALVLEGLCESVAEGPEALCGAHPTLRPEGEKINVQ